MLNKLFTGKGRHQKGGFRWFHMKRKPPEGGKINPTSELIHLVFDVSEKILLASLLIQPGQMHFVTENKLDFFEVACRNINWTYIFGVPEGHWQMNKTSTKLLLWFIMQLNWNVSRFPFVSVIANLFYMQKTAPSKTKLHSYLTLGKACMWWIRVWDWYKLSSPRSN